MPVSSFTASLGASTFPLLLSNFLVPIPLNIVIDGNQDGAYSTAAGLYTIPFSGAYEFGIEVTFSFFNNGPFTLGGYRANLLLNESVLARLWISFQIAIFSGNSITLSGTFRGAFVKGDTVGVGAQSLIPADVRGASFALPPWRTTLFGLPLFSTQTNLQTLSDSGSCLGPTGPTGPSGSHSNVPTTFFSVALVSTATLFISATTVTATPFTKVLVGNTDGAYDVSQSRYIVPASGFYAFDAWISIQYSNGTLAGSQITFSLQNNAQTITQSINQSNQINAQNNPVSLSIAWTGYFQKDDVVTIIPIPSPVTAGNPNTAFSYLAATGDFAPWNTVFSGKSLF